MARVRITEALTRYSDGTAEHQVAGTTIAEVFAGLWTRFPELRSRVVDDDGRVFSYLVLFVNGQESPRDQLDLPVGDADELEIIGAVAGG